MATTDELLAEAEASADEESNGYDYLVINTTDRSISIPSSVTLLGVESDDEVQRLYFKMPATYGEFDLSTFGIRINYMNANNVGDVYVVDDATSDGTNITFSWLVGRIATAYKGNTSFIVCAKLADSDGNVEKEFNTTIATLPVLQGLETTEAVVSENPDVIEQLLKIIASIDPDAVGGDVTYSDGVGISSMVQTTSSTTSSGANVWTAVLTDGSKYNFTVYNGAQGSKGDTGVGIKSLVQTTVSAEDGGANEWTATLTDGSTSTLVVRNGSKGSAGDSTSSSGKSAYEYAQAGGYTGTEEEFAQILGGLQPDPLYGKKVLCFGDSLMTANSDYPDDTLGYARIIKNKHPGAEVYNYGISGSCLSANAVNMFNDSVWRKSIIAEFEAKLSDTASYPGLDSPDYIVFDGSPNDFACIIKYGYEYKDYICGDPSSISLDNNSTTYDTLYNALDYLLYELISLYPATKIVYIGMYHPHVNMYKIIPESDFVETSSNLAIICEKYGVTYFDQGNTTLGIENLVRWWETDDTLFTDDTGHMSEAGYDLIADTLDACMLTGISNSYSDRHSSSESQSVYEYATEAGYTGTEDEFSERLVSLLNTVDGDEVSY